MEDSNSNIMEANKVECPNCKNTKFEDVGYTWVGCKNIKFYKTTDGSIRVGYDDSQDEVYWQGTEHLYYECLQCENAYILERGNSDQLIEINAYDDAISKDKVKSQVKKLLDSKQKLDKEVKQLIKQITRLKEESKELEKFIAISNNSSKRSILKGIKRLRT